MNDKIREVALKVKRDFFIEGRSYILGTEAIDFLTRCLDELSKDVEPVAYYDCQEREFCWAKPTIINAPVTVKVEPVPLYAAPPLTELSKDVEPVAIRKWSEIDDDYVYSNDIDFPTYRDFGWEPVYLHPPLTEQDKLDAARLDWLSNVDASKFILSCGKRWYWRKGYSQPHQRVETLREAIDKAMENGK